MFFDVPLFIESKEKFRVVFCCFTGIKNIVAAPSFSKISVILVCWGVVVFACFEKSMSIIFMVEII